MNEEYLVFYITFSKREEAELTARLLVEKKLAACVNILGEINSFYEWKGRIEKSTEVSLIAKTRRKNSKSLIKFIENTHSYETPCIISFKVENGSKGFLDWISDSLGNG